MNILQSLRQRYKQWQVSRITEGHDNVRVGIPNTNEFNTVVDADTSANLKISEHTIESGISWFDPPERFVKLPALAERLGVKPVDPLTSGNILLTMKDGRNYDVIDIINALLDRLDQATPNTGSGVSALEEGK